MKSSFIKRLVKKFWFAGFAASVICLFSFAPASTNPANDKNISASIQVKYLGGDNEALFFKVKYENKGGTRFKLLALNETGEALFQDDYTAKDFEKKIKVPRLTETDYVIFLLRSPKENVELSYKVKVTTKVVDGRVIVKN